MLLLLLNLAFAENDTGNPQQPNLSITVTDTRSAEIYMEKPKVTCDSCSYKNDTSTLFVAANRHHRAWFQKGIIHAVYNQDTVSFRYPECDFAKDTAKCIKENSVWLLRSSITIDNNRASLSLILIDEFGKVVGQSTYVKHKKTQIVNKEKEVKATGGVVGSGYHSNETEPVVIELMPEITQKDIDQAMIILYDSIR
jgi:hypothetical protein